MKLVDMVYSIDQTSYIPNETQLKEVEMLIKYEHLFEDEVKSSLSAAWN